MNPVVVFLILLGDVAVTIPLCILAGRLGDWLGDIGQKKHRFFGDDDYI